MMALPRGRAGAPPIEISVESPLWNSVPDAEAAVRRAVETAARSLVEGAELSVVLTNDEAIRALNRRWRGRDAATNVLSFPSPCFLPPPLRGRVGEGGRPAESGFFGSPPSRRAEFTFGRASGATRWRVDLPRKGGGKNKATAPLLLGDIVIAFETTVHEAELEGRPLVHHLSHLAVHGFLHLLGYDHESEDDAELMERLERDILEQLDVPDPYASREADNERHV